ncbi:DUF2971 domain-containing protein (plasmid) [Pantoea sp. C3]|uniref:DUF2971 domain-containing protein n=1 Tax=Pantoea phytostimulans TaxID=2769024 RepID=UPI0038F6FE3C
MSRTDFSFYKYGSIDIAKRILTGGTVYYNNPLNFNDPFDCNPVYTPEQLIKDVQASFKQYGNQDIDSDHASRSINMVPILQQGLLREMACSNLGVTCFSLDPFNPPMWYHYASQHMGVVIEFKPTDDLPIETHTNNEYKKIHPRKVEYYHEGDMPRVDGAVQSYDILFHKTKHWEYEQEVRDVQGKDGVVKFDRIQIGKVYGGIQISSENREELKEIINCMNNDTGGSAEYVQLGIDYETYKMIIL